MLKKICYCCVKSKLLKMFNASGVSINGLIGLIVVKEPFNNVSSENFMLEGPKIVKFHGKFNV